MVVSSATRWLEYLFNIWPFRTIKICPKVKIFAKVGSNFGLPNTKYLLKKWPITF